MDDIGGRQHGKGNDQNRSDGRTQKGHLDGVKQGLPYLGHIIPLGWDHIAQDYKKFPDAADQHREAEAWDPNRQRRHRQQDQHGERRSGTAFTTLLPIGKRKHSGCEQLIIKGHTRSSRLL